MTGAEILIKQGEDCVLGKVRHGGDDIIDYIKEKDDKLFDISFDNMWKEYYAWRIKDFSDICIQSEIQSKYQKTGFKGKITKSDVPIEQFSKTCYDLEQEIEKIDDNDGLLCGYGDYHVMIDCDDKKVYVPSIDGEKMMELKEAEAEEIKAFEEEKKAYIEQQKMMLESTFGDKRFQTEREKKLEEILGKMVDITFTEDISGKDIKDVLAIEKDKIINVINNIQAVQDKCNSNCGDSCGSECSGRCH